MSPLRGLIPITSLSDTNSGGEQSKSVQADRCAVNVAHLRSSVCSVCITPASACRHAATMRIAAASACWAQLSCSSASCLHRSASARLYCSTLTTLCRHQDAFRSVQVVYQYRDCISNSCLARPCGLGYHQTDIAAASRRAQQVLPPLSLHLVLEQRNKYKPCCRCRDCKHIDGWWQCACSSRLCISQHQESVSVNLQSKGGLGLEPRVEL